MKPVINETDDDYLFEFAKWHNLKAEELLIVSMRGVKAMREYLQMHGIVDDFPRKPRAPQSARTGAAK